MMLITARKQRVGSKVCRSMLSGRIIGPGDDYGNLMTIVKTIQ